jgi:hypothetical protein
LVFSDYILPFEIASLVLLAAMIGAIYLARSTALEEERSRSAAASETTLANSGDV